MSTLAIVFALMGVAAYSTKGYYEYKGGGLRVQSIGSPE